MAQSSKELEAATNQKLRTQLVTNMRLTKDQIVEMNPEDVFDMDEESMDANLKGIGVTVGTTWSD